MATGRNSEFSVGDWRVEPDLNRISLGSQTTTLRPQVMELLVYLAGQDGRVVSADELLDNLWAGKVVTDNAVYNCVAELRHALAEEKDATPYIETVPRKGYRLLAPIGEKSLRPTDSGPDGPATRKRALSIAVVGAVAAIGAWLLIPRDMTADLQSAPGSRVTSAEGNAGRFPADSTGKPGLMLSLSLPGYADQSTNYTWPSIALSPDGRQIAYIGFDGTDTHLYLKRADHAHPRRISHTDGASVPFFSPDGAWVGFFADGKIQRVRTDGGRPMTVGTVPGVPTGASWSTDNYLYFAVGYRSYLQRIPVNGGPAEAITKLAENDYTHRRPEVLPGGDALLYQSGSPSSIMQSEPAEIWLLDLRTGNRRFLIEGANPRYSDDALVFERDTSGGHTIWRIDFDLDKLQSSGDPVPLVSTPVEDFTVSRSGALLYVEPRTLERSILRIVDGQGSTELDSFVGPASYPRFSPDNKTLAVTVGDKIEGEIWRYDLQGNQLPAQLTTDFGGFHTWSPTGSHIAYYRWTDGIFSQSVRDSGPPERLVDLKGFVLPLDWTAKGLLFMKPHPYARDVLFFQKDNADRQPVTVKARVPVDAKISPDGEWLVYSRMDGGRPDVVVTAFPEGGKYWKISGTLAGDHPKWSEDGRWIYFESFNRLMAVEVEYGSAISFGAPREILRFSGRSDITHDPFDAAKEPARFAIVDTIYGDPPQHVYVSDWRQLPPSN